LPGVPGRPHLWTAAQRSAPRRFAFEKQFLSLGKIQFADVSVFTYLDHYKNKEITQ